MSPPPAPRRVADRPAAPRTPPPSLTAAFVAHDVRGPLRQIMELAGLAAEAEDAAARDTLLEEVRAVAARTAMLLDHLLRLEAPEDRSGRPPLSLRPVVEAAAAHHESARRDAGVAVNIHGDARVPGDGVLLEQLFRNLIGNALKYRRGQAPSVTVHLSQTLDGAEVVVADNGVGIPVGERASVFEPYVRGSGAERDGHGVGLALAARVVDAHGGRIRAVRPGPGEATRIMISLPGATISTESLSDRIFTT